MRVHRRAHSVARGVAQCLAAGPCGVFIHHGFFTLAVIWTLNGDAADRWAPALAVSLLTAANEAGLVAHVLGAPDRIAALRRLYGFSIIAALCATAAWCYADTRLRRRRASFRHVPLLLSCCHLHLLRMYVRRWARTQTLTEVILHAYVNLASNPTLDRTARRRAARRHDQKREHVPRARRRRQRR